ncbi:glycosyltransferase family 9 protein [Kutzneria kofuensis]|uniref:ADP-heptose:LPS heptosyltransferase n=1 Tax=Kutzneria kofuensis TaxID=103725 RepID=A0A7W9KR44_9PSEU|nr:glycosyltransferase family 9 protein [Kutzneria kofuensis]MBB5897197.1 ADP-heptose:LPS heptosyltransferase [Kutzneria kofuensis]
MRRQVLVVRLDSEGDVLVSGPAVRAAAQGNDVTFLCGPRGKQAARMLPGVSDVLVWRCPWIDPTPSDVDRRDIESVRKTLQRRRFDTALILTSYHQSPLPMALVLRMAGVPWIAAVSEDYPGSLLDIRLRPGIEVDEDLPEPERALTVARAAGFALGPADDGRLAVRALPKRPRLVGNDPYVVLHPGASVPSRAWSPERCAETVIELARRGIRVVVTGSPDERALTARVAGHCGLDLGGRTTFSQLAATIAGADALVVGNTGPAHLAAAVGTPVVSLFSPVVPSRRWAPYRVPYVLLGDQDSPCRDSRARICPLAGHPCLNDVTAAEVADAVEAMQGVRA